MSDCRDCRCDLANSRGIYGGPYCDYCLLERAKAGEQVDVGAGDIAVLCPKCHGTGQVILTAWQPDIHCHKCGGYGLITVDTREVQRMQRWSATFQTNKVTRS